MLQALLWLALCNPPAPILTIAPVERELKVGDAIYFEYPRMPCP